MNIKERWLNWTLHFSARVNQAKMRLSEAQGFSIIFWALWVAVLELVNLIVSLPAYIFIADVASADQNVAQGYRLRRVVSLSVIAGVIGAWLIKIGIVALIGAGIFSHGGHRAKADTVSWDFNNPVAYLYDSSKIQIVDGMAILKASPTSLLNTATSTPEIPTQNNISLPPTTGTVSASADTSVTTNTSVPTGQAGSGSTTNTSPSVDANINTNTGAAPVETSPLAPVVETVQTVTQPVTPPAPAPTPVVPSAPVAPPAPTPTPVEAPAAPAPTPPAPSAPSGGGLLPFLQPKTVYAQAQTCSAIIQPLVPLAPINLQNWNGFSDVVNGGTAEYQLSTDAGLTWQYWNGSAWSAAGSDNFTGATIINAHISSFSHTTNSILFRAKITGDCGHDVQLLGVSVDYEHIPPVIPTATSTTYTLTAPTGITFTDEYGNAISATTKSAYITIGSQRIAYVELKGNLNLSTSVVLNNPTAVLTNIDLLNSQNIDKFELMVPKVLGQTEISLCPSLTALNAILPACPGGAALSATNPTANLSVLGGQGTAAALVKLDAPDYWYVDISTTGIIAVAATQVPEVVVTTPTTPEVSTSTCATLFSGNTLAGAASALSTAQDYSFTSKMTVSSSGASGVKFRTQDSSNFYQLLFNNGSVSLGGEISGSATQLQNSNVAAFAPQVGLTYNVKVQVHGGLIRAKWWPEGTSEPGTWMIYANDSRILSGAIGLIDSTSSLLGGAAAGATYSNLSVSTCLEDDAVSIQEINTQNLISNNQPPAISNVVGVQMHDDGYVDITYNLSDPESDYSHLTGFEYSTTGAFNGEQKDITLADTDIDSHGTNVLSTSASGTPHTLVWHAAADLGNVYDPTVYIRLKPADTLHEGEFAESSSFAVDVKKPVVSSLSGTQGNTVALENNMGVVSYHLVNQPVSNVISQSQISLDNGLTWENLASATTSIEVGTINVVNKYPLPSGALGIDQNNIKVRVEATDEFKNTSGWVTSSDFSIDTKTPFGMANFHGQSSNETEILWQWSPVVVESNFDHYLISIQPDNGGAPSVRDFTNTNNANLGIMGTNSFLATGLQPDTYYHANIYAYDSFGNFSQLPSAEFRTQTTTPAPNPNQNSGTNVNVGGSANVETGGPNASTTIEGSGNGNGTSVNVGENNNITIPEVLPPIADNPPVAPSGGFRIVVDENSKTTSTTAVTLGLAAGSNVVTMAISNFADMHDAVQQPYSANVEWNLCQQDGVIVSIADCAEGRHLVYVRFYTEFGISSNQVSDSITLRLPVAEVVVNPSSSGANVEVTTGSGSAVSQPASGGSSGGGGGGSNGGGLPPAGNSNNNSGGQNNGSLAYPGLQTPTSDNSSNGSQNSNSNGSLSIQSIAPSSIPIISELNKTKESPILAVPEVSAVKQSAISNNIELSGKAIPGSQVAIFIHSDQVVVYSTKVGSDGTWKYIHSQDEVDLTPGQHTVFAVTYDPGSRIKSKVSEIKTFVVTKNRLAEFRKYLDLPTTLLTLFALLLGIVYLWTRKNKTNLA